MLKVGGIWVSPVEVATLIKHAAVLEAAVVGKEDDDRLVKPKAFVVLKEPTQASAALGDELKAFVGQDRALQISSLDRVRGRAAQDGHRQDPALQARLSVFEPALETLSRERCASCSGASSGAGGRGRRRQPVPSPEVRRRRRPARLGGFRPAAAHVKAEFVADQAATPFGTNLTYPVERYVRVHQTSGTSGKPIRWLDTQESWDWWIRCWGFVLRGAGLSAADRVFFPFSFGLFIGFWAGSEGARALGALTIPGGGWTRPRGWPGWSPSAPPRWCAPPPMRSTWRSRASAEWTCAGWACARRSTPGSPALPPCEPDRSGLGAKAFDHAGMTEMGAFGYECLAQAGLHVNETEFIAEVIDPVTGVRARGRAGADQPRPCGLPAIRYRTGDRVRLAEGPAPAGGHSRGWRAASWDASTTCSSRGVNVFPSAIEDIVRRHPEIDEFQIEVFRDGARRGVRCSRPRTPSFVVA